MYPDILGLHTSWTGFMEVGFLMISFNARSFRAVLLVFWRDSDDCTFNICEFASVDRCASWHKWNARPSKKPTSCVPDESKMHHLCSHTTPHHQMSLLAYLVSDIPCYGWEEMSRNEHCVSVALSAEYVEIAL